MFIIFVEIIARKENPRMITFGPIPSRRLGKSLGINNILRPKVCSYSCVYCQVGRTKEHSLNRQVFFEPAVIIHEVETHLEKLSPADMPDYLTFVSNGEPTLDLYLGKSIKMLKKLNIPIAVITNASLLQDGSVHDSLCKADWVSIKVDAGDADTWQKVNRPAAGLIFKNVIEGLHRFASDYKGTLATETMLCKGVNDAADNVSSVVNIIKRLNPDKAYISVPVRPPAEKTVFPPDTESMNHAWQIFNEAGIKTELLTGFEGVNTGFTGNIYEDILNITAVHPLREDTLSELLEKNKSDFKVVQSLINQRLIRCITYRGKKFYLREFKVNE
jgi:wyosine [tRNA(Phe)-imidazoG37] synthetase (radical SAM superfamily)